MDIDEILSDPYKNFGFLLGDTTRLLGTRVDRSLREAGLTLSRSQWRVIARLNSEDGQTQTRLAEKLDMEKAPLGALIDKLESIHLVERKSCLHDRRAKRVHITEKGRELAPTIQNQATGVLSLAITNIEPADLQTFMSCLEIMKANLVDDRQLHKETK